MELLMIYKISPDHSFPKRGTERENYAEEGNKGRTQIKGNKGKVRSGLSDAEEKHPDIMEAIDRIRGTRLRILGK